MIKCPNCQHPNMDGAMFCSECGSHLLRNDKFNTQAISNTTTEAQPAQAEPAAHPAAPFIGHGGEINSWGNLHLLDTGQVIPLTGRSEYTLGRISDGQPIMPDIDLSPYQAYASGVSRLHAVVKRDSQRVVIMDLGSANGTYINGRRLTPNVEQVLNHGDIVAFGKLKIQVLLKN